MKKDKEWLIKRVENYIPLNDKTVGHVVDNILDIIRQLDEPEVLSQDLPVVPKHVADWIVIHREKYDLYPALKKLEGNPFGWDRIYEWYRLNNQKFVNAYLTGEYEVEGEQKYYALIKGHELITDEGIFTCKYWNFNASNGDVLPSNRLLGYGNFLAEMSKAEWNKLGINDSNADFVEADEELN